MNDSRSFGFEDGLNLYSYVHNSPLTHVDPDGQYGFLITIAVGFLVSHAIDYVLPVAVSYVGQCAGGTAAALVSGTLKGYNMDYSQGLFANDPILCSTEKAGMVFGTLFAIRPDKLAQAGITAANVAKKELAHYGSELASKRFGNLFSASGNTARKLASETTATCAKTVERATEKALEKTAEKATTAAAEKGLAKVAKEGKKLDLDAFSKAGHVMDRSNLTRAGCALDKHGNRLNSPFPKATGNSASKNLQGQFHLDEILTHPNCKIIRGSKGDIRFYHPNGSGARFRSDGSFKGFLDYE